jgi:phosphate transport system substrate-binding protein
MLLVTDVSRSCHKPDLACPPFNSRQIHSSRAVAPEENDRKNAVIQAKLFPALGALVLAAACSRQTDQTQQGSPAGSAQGGTEVAAKAAAKSGDRVLQNKGSDTLVNVAQAWAEAYKGIDPSVAVAVSGGGSGVGISALINKTVDIANASREMKTKEVDDAKAKGVNPVAHVVGHDALAVIVHKANPLKEIDLAKLAAIYGENGTIDKWSQLNVKVPGCDSDEIIRFSRQSNSGTYTYFKEAILKEGEYKDDAKESNGSKQLVDSVATTPCGIGYDGLAYVTPQVASVCVIDKAGKCVPPTVAGALDGSYPIARPLFMYTDGEPTGQAKAYLDWIKSDKGQCLIQDKGYAPIRQVKCDG